MTNGYYYLRRKDGKDLIQIVRVSDGFVYFTGDGVEKSLASVEFNYEFLARASDEPPNIYLDNRKANWVKAG